MPPATVIDGRAIAAAIRQDVASRASALHERGIDAKCIAIVSDGDAPGLLYAQTARRAGEDVGVIVHIVPVGSDADTSGAIAIVARSVEEPTAHAVIIQRPMSKRVDEAQIVGAMDPRKDVDCCHPYNVGLLALGTARFAPATAVAVIELLRHADVLPLRGARVAVLGRSAVVGRPTAMLLTAADATVTICHSKTEHLADICRESDIVVAAIGKPNFVTGDMLRPGAVVIDVGTNVVSGRLVGDVDASARDVAGAISLVPGGVGPVTTAVLLRSIVSAAEGG
ncbi:MAG TPA: bifunctional 5,10-methylenetetrahydrofolate dehydrogenase/5,10-methenyltetrahydrofolate cyclohydrolase [Candidatus Eremiobacteraceae bacterium]|nr:bifunctional 5,10-methylenetetrahydrofolate dehydrogenase/5,10-methenyltetrahydrofolate cyclohydrolase [Candidatus Eremiobacteraceae bacterium]